MSNNLHFTVSWGESLKSSQSNLPLIMALDPQLIPESGRDEEANLGQPMDNWTLTESLSQRLPCLRTCREQK